MKILIISVLSLGAVAVLIALFKSGHFFENLFKTAIQGIISLIAVNVTGLATGVTLCVNWYTIASVSIFGLPGTIALTVFKFIFKS